jgi:hypothetical protein
MDDKRKKRPVTSKLDFSGRPTAEALTPEAEDGLRMMKALGQIHCPNLRRALITLAEAMARDGHGLH